MNYFISITYFSKPHVLIYFHIQQRIQRGGVLPPHVAWSFQDQNILGIRVVACQPGIRGRKQELGGHLQDEFIQVQKLGTVVQVVRRCAAPGIFKWSLWKLKSSLHSAKPGPQQLCVPGGRAFANCSAQGACLFLVLFCFFICLF